MMNFQEDSIKREKLNTILYGICDDILSCRSNSFKFSKEAADVDKLAYKEYLAAILLASEDIKLTYMLHFWLEDAKKIAANQWNKDVCDVEYWRAIDYFKEFCNLLAGKTKEIFRASNITFGQSLPVAINGFNLALFNLNLQNTYHLYWAQRSGDVELSFSVHYAFQSSDCLDKIQNIPDKIHSDENSVEFL